MLTGKRILITGGTGSLGKVLTRRLLSGEIGTPKSILIFSRDEAKQHAMRLDYQNRRRATDEVIYHNFENLLQFRIGDVRDYHGVCAVLRQADMVFNAAALKQVPACEYFPYEAVQTNIGGPENIVRAIREHQLPVETVVGISTDKACKPVNVMGMTKAIQERVFITANLDCPDTRFICVRYGNVLASRGSVIPLFHDQIAAGGPVTITDDEMTRFLLSLDQAVDTIFAALKEGRRGETYIPRVPSAKVVDIATALIAHRKIDIRITGIRPGEKLHEILVSEEEAHRTMAHGDYYVIQSILPEVRGDGGQRSEVGGRRSEVRGRKSEVRGRKSEIRSQRSEVGGQKSEIRSQRSEVGGQRSEGIQPALTGEYSSASDLMTAEECLDLLKKHKLMIEEKVEYEGELLR